MAQTKALEQTQEGILQESKGAENAENAALLARQAELDEKEARLKDREDALSAAIKKLDEQRAVLEAERNADAIASKQNEANRWRVKADCFAKNVLYHEGDVIKGGDFSGNPNFEKLN